MKIPLQLENMHDPEATTLDDFDAKLKSAVEDLEYAKDMETTRCCAPTPAEKAVTVRLAQARVDTLRKLMPLLEAYVAASDAHLLHLDPLQ